MKINDDFCKIKNAVPTTANSRIDWERLEKTELKPIFDKMSATMQNPEYHGEGDVLSHTRLVCEELIKQPQYIAESDNGKTVLFLAALLHDIGKIKCTKIKDGQLVSPHHSSIGAIMARELLWKQFGLCGSPEKQRMREAICNLVRYHSFPPYAMSDKNSELKLLKIAANGELVKDFTIKKLCLLERADVLGRISANCAEYLERIEYCQMIAEELGCIEGPYSFSSAFSQRAFFLGKTKWREQNMFKDTWGEVIIMSGLPGTGKDTWIEKNCPDIPMISLDEIRKRLHISPTDNQGEVVAVAHEQAKEYLRKRQRFVWNATGITAQLRAKQISLFEQYNASVKIVFLETEWEEQLLRNSQRQAVVPQRVIEKMLSSLEIPERFESETVSWEIT